MALYRQQQTTRARYAAASFVALVGLIVTSPGLAGPLWTPGAPGERMFRFTHNTDGTHRRIDWAEHAGFTIRLDDAAIYDGRRRLDNAPQVRIELAGDLADLREKDFVITVRTQLAPGRGRRFHAGLCIGFGQGDLLVFGPQNSANLRFEWSTTGNGVTAPYDLPHAFLKLKRRGDQYTAWFSRDGEFFKRVHTVTVDRRPVHVGAILMNWGAPHRQEVGFRHFEITHVEGEPNRYQPNVIVGDDDGEALHFVHVVSGMDILFRVMVRAVPGNRAAPFNSKLYFIHGSHAEEAQPFSAIHSFRAVCDELVTGRGSSYHMTNMLLIALRFPRGAHPFLGRDEFHYQTLSGEEDRILMDLHEDFIRERFPADGPQIDDRFALFGHSGGGQFVVRFLMAHGPKLHRAVASSPASYAFPTAAMYWPYGDKVPETFAQSNPRLKMNREAAFGVPVGVVVGANDNIIDRGTEEERYRPRPMTWSRMDGARKWVRQMAHVSKGRAQTALYVCPGSGHSLTDEKIRAALLVLLGAGSDRDQVERWRYSFTVGRQDDSKQVAPVRIPDELFHYFKFNRFRMPNCSRFERYDFRPDGACVVSDEDGKVTANCSWSLSRPGGRLRLTVRDHTYIQAYVLYGRLRLYTDDLRYMLEQSPIVTPLFVREQAVGPVLYPYVGTGRGAEGPTAVPAGSGPFQLRANGTVVHAGTDRLYARRTMQRWHYDNRTHLLRFADRKGKDFDPFRMGEWRWGMRPDGRVFLAGLCTADTDGRPRMEMQTDARYNPRYFEEWDTGPETWPRPRMDAEGRGGATGKRRGSAPSRNPGCPCSRVGKPHALLYHEGVGGERFWEETYGNGTAYGLADLRRPVVDGCVLPVLLWGRRGFGPGGRGAGVG